MKKLFNTYYRLLKQQNLSPKHKQNVYVPDIFIDLSKIKIIKIYNNENIILQQSNNDYRKLVDKIYNCNNGQQFNNIDILKYTSNTFKYREFIKKYNILPFYVFKTQFSIAKGIYSIFSYLDSTFKTKFPSIKLFQDAFIQDYNICNGLLIELGPCFLMLLNNNNFNFITIQHQLYHYFYMSIPSFQKIQNFINTLNIPEKGIPQLNISKQTIQYVLSEYQLNAYIHINLYKELKAIYYLYFNSISKQQYINNIFKNIQTLSNKELKNSQIFIAITNYLSRFNKNNMCDNYLVLLKVYYLFNKQFYFKIKQKILSYFI